MTDTFRLSGLVAFGWLPACERSMVLLGTPQFSLTSTGPTFGYPPFEFQQWSGRHVKMRWVFIVRFN
jgi:hypothetical protein